MGTRLISGVFPGLSEVTGAGNVGAFQHHHKLPSGFWIVHQLQIGSANPAAFGAGTTTLRISVGNYATAGESISLSLGPTDTSAAPGGAHLLAWGGIYVYLTSVGGHSNAQYSVLAKAI